MKLSIVILSFSFIILSACSNDADYQEIEQHTVEEKSLDQVAPTNGNTSDGGTHTNCQDCG